MWIFVTDSELVVTLFTFTSWDESCLLCICFLQVAELLVTLFTFTIVPSWDES